MPAVKFGSGVLSRDGPKKRLYEKTERRDSNRREGEITRKRFLPSPKLLVFNAEITYTTGSTNEGNSAPAGTTIKGIVLPPEKN
jgi:hypothetical protein